MLLETLSTPFAKVRPTNQTSASFISKIPTLVTPPAAAVTAATDQTIIETGKGGGAFIQNMGLFVPYGIGSDTNTFSMRIIGWDRIWTTSATQRIELWVPVLLAEFLCTLSSGLPGIATAPVLNTEYFCNTITTTYGNDNVSSERNNPAAAGLLCHAVVDLKGFHKIEVTFSTGSSATSCNALYRLF